MTNFPRLPHGPAARLAAVGLAYFLADGLAVLGPMSADIFAMYWPAAGLGVAALLLAPRSLWLAVLAAMYLGGNAANLLLGRSLGPSLGFMLANCLESLSCAWAITRLCGEEVRFARVRDVAALLLVTAGASGVGAFVGASVAWLATRGSYWVLWQSWWIGDGLGILLFAPLIVVWARPALRGARSPQLVAAEVVAVTATFLGLAWLAFSVPGDAPPLYPRPYALVLPLAWAALRLGPRETLTTIALAATLVLVISSAGVGTTPLHGATREEQLLAVQVFVAVITSVALFLTASLTEILATKAALADSEATARRGQAKLAVAMDLARLGSWDYDVAADRFRFDPNMRAIYGLPPGDELFLSAAEYAGRFVHPEDAGVVAREIGASLAASAPGTAPEVQHRIVRADGSQGWVLVRYAIEKDATGRTVRLFGANQDVTARAAAEEAQARAERALRESEARFRGLVEISPFPTLMVDDSPRSAVRLLNRSFLETFGYTLADVPDVEAWWPRAYPDPAYCAQIQADWAHALAVADAAGRPTIEPIEVRIRCKDGSERRCEVHLGRFGGHALVIFNDVTSREAALDALRESEERFRGAFEHTPLGMAIVSADGHWIRVNDSLTRMVGRSEEALRAMTFHELTHPADREPTRVEADRMLAGHVNGYRLEKRYLHADGHPVPVIASGTLIRDRDGAPSHYVTQIQDMTERRAREEELRRSLEEKDVLLREVHHRVKNNLQVVSSLLSLQAEKLPDPALRAALQESQLRVRSLALIHEELYRAKTLSRLSIRDYLEHLVQAIYRSYGADPGAIRLALDVGDLSVPLDSAVPIGLCVHELVSNALKHAFPDGRSGTIEVALHAASPGQLELVVADDGCGLPPVAAAEGSRSLGLLLVQSLARQVQGQLSIERSPGTRFRLTFPAGGPS